MLDALLQQPLGDEDRRAQLVQLDFHGKVVTVANVHLTHLQPPTEANAPGWRARQLATLGARDARYIRRVVAAVRWTGVAGRALLFLGACLVLGGVALRLLPVGWNEFADVGLQIVGNYFDEARMLGAAHRFQQATDWHLRRPA
mgnify:CR=1 FL=1